MAVTTEVLLASGREVPGATVRAATPVSMRRPGDLRANASAGVSFPVETTVDAAGHPQVADLAAIRARFELPPGMRASAVWPDGGDGWMHLDAQAYLETWYASMGFETVSDVFLEAGIEHVSMVLRPASA